jgi:Tol biopolymer transport system component
MKNSPNIARHLLPMTLALAGLMLWNVLLTSSPAQAVRAASSPPVSTAVTNGRIAFNRDGEIFAMNADGSDLKQLTFAGGGGALWSPDGTKIALVSASGTSPNYSSQICVMNADGSNQECLTPSGENVIYPAWSPDSTQIAFERVIIIGVSGAGATRRPVL